MDGVYQIQTLILLHVWQDFFGDKLGIFTDIVLHHFGEKRRMRYGDRIPPIIANKERRRLETCNF
jgi:hypothetical protein